MRIFFLLLALLFSSNSYANEFLTVDPPELNDPELKGMQWNRWVAGKFTILSVDDAVGEKLASSTNAIKSNILAKWNFADFEFAHECRVFCVPNKSMLKKLFGRTENTFENRLGTEDNLVAIWLILPDVSSTTSSEIYPFFAKAIFSEYESIAQVSLGHWFVNGASELCGSPVGVRERLSSLPLAVQGGEIFFSKSLLEMNQEKYAQLPKATKTLYEAESVALCLMLRQEFGYVKLNSFLKNSMGQNYDSVFPRVYGFKDCKDFDSKFSIYLKDLSKCYKEDRIPDIYLTIGEKQ
jgi:hypothetical protein